MKQPIQYNYILHNHIPESVSSAKYLGITVQSNLKWDKHINDITSKATKHWVHRHLFHSKNICPLLFLASR
jgi:hypothetical protein